MKKLIALLCMLTCVCGLTACGGEEALNEYQVGKVENAEQYAVNTIIPMMEESIANVSIMDIYNADGYTVEEWEAVLSSTFGVAADGAAYLKAIDSFSSGSEEMGAFLSFGEAESKIDGEEIIVYVDVDGELKDGQVEMIFSNDYFTELKSCTLNVNAEFGELMAKAALNTLLGMGTVFSVLILIMLIISAFGYIPKPQSDQPVKKAPVPAKVEAPVVEETAEEADDYALVAVIAAAVAAYTGQTTTDGFVVRSIKKSRRR